MTIKKRTILDRCEVLPSGHIQVRHCIEEYDDTITPAPAVKGVYEEVEISPYKPAILEQITEGENKGKFREVSPAKAAVFETVTITEPVAEIIDVVGEVEFHRHVVAAGDVIPPEIIAFQQAHKMIPCKKFDLYDRRHPND